jgi:hypothetical protein
MGAVIFPASCPTLLIILYPLVSGLTPLNELDIFLVSAQLAPAPLPV